MFGLGVSELLLVFGILLFMFGSKKIPSLAKGMGEAIREFKKAKDDVELSKEDETHKKS